MGLISTDASKTFSGYLKIPNFDGNKSKKAENIALFLNPSFSRRLVWVCSPLSCRVFSLSGRMCEKGGAVYTLVMVFLCVVGRSPRKKNPEQHHGRLVISTKTKGGV